VEAGAAGEEMRYYFHVVSVKRSWRDYVGLSCFNVDDAKNHAGFMANELLRLLGDKLINDERLKAMSLLVMDERGKEVTRIPFKIELCWRSGLH
jgi:hypothetical protein